MTAPRPTEAQLVALRIAARVWAAATYGSPDEDRGYALRRASALADGSQAPQTNADAAALAVLASEVQS